MNLIDIASWQQGLDLKSVFNLNPALDGVIVKVSQGTGYVNPFAKEWLDWLVANGKAAGTYHYLDLMGAEAEARHYAESVKPWLGKVALAIDYEEQTLSKGTAYLKACLDEVYRLTGVKPLVYCSQSVTQSQDFSAIASNGYKLWVAQYADMNPVYGFIETPWQKGSVFPFDGYVMHQYTSNGRLNGWNSGLDFDKFTGDWDSLISGQKPTPTPTPTLKPADPVVVSEVLSGRYGTGQNRINALKQDGYDPESVQAKINELYGIAAKVKKDIGNETAYINSIIKIARM